MLSAGRSTSSAARLSFSCGTLFGPMIGEVIPGRARFHARATASGEAFA